jgi:hypothetical protein
MNIVQLVYKQTEKRIGSIRIYFVVKGVGILHDPEGALKAIRPFKKISVVIVGKLYTNLSSKEKEDTSIEIKRYSFLKRNEFAKDFGLKIKNGR